MNQHLQVLMDNFHGAENSFLYRLSEEAFFDADLFGEYYQSLKEIVRQTLGQPLDRELARAVSFTQAKILEHLLWEYADDDAFQIGNFPFGRLHAFIERLNAAVDGYFQGYLVDEQSFGGEWLTEPGPSVIHLDFLKQGLDIHAVGFKNKDGAYEVFLDEGEDKALADSRVTRKEARGRFIFPAPDASAAFRIFHEWVMKNYAPYSSAMGRRT